MSEVPGRLFGATSAADFTAALDALGERLRSVDGVQAALDEVVDGAVAAVPGAVGAAIVVPGGEPPLRPRATSGALPPVLVDLQNVLNEGPTVEALSATRQFMVEDLTEHSARRRWPQFADQAAQLGARAMICTPMTIGARTTGTLSVVTDVVGGFGPEAGDLASVFASHAGLAVAGAERQVQLDAAVQSRDIIGQAKGILMERYKVDATVAFSILVRASKDGNIKLRQVCEHLCHTGEVLGLDKSVARRV